MTTVLVVLIVLTIVLIIVYHGSNCFDDSIDHSIDNYGRPYFLGLIINCGFLLYAKKKRKLCCFFLFLFVLVCIYGVVFFFKKLLMAIFVFFSFFSLNQKKLPSAQKMIGAPYNSYLQLAEANYCCK